MRLPRFGLIALFACVLPLHPAKALMNFGTTQNTTDPSNGAPWTNVGEMENGSGAAMGSGVYLGGLYVLTANHVLASQIDIGGTLFFVDTSFNASYVGGSFSSGVSEIGNADLKLVRLTLDPSQSGIPGLQATVSLNTSTSRDTNSSLTNYIVGFGEGKGFAIVGTGTNGWNWDGVSGTERWGTNNILGTQLVASGTMVTSTLKTNFSSTMGSSEAAVETNDSGGALFVQSTTNSPWFLSGITLYASMNGSSYTSGDPVTGGATENYFGRISTYASLIDTAMAAVPEPSTCWLGLGGMLLLLVRFRRWIPKAK